MCTIATSYVQRTYPRTNVGNQTAQFSAAGVSRHVGGGFFVINNNAHACTFKWWSNNICNIMYATNITIRQSK